MSRRSERRAFKLSKHQQKIDARHQRRQDRNDRKAHKEDDQLEDHESAYENHVQPAKTGLAQDLEAGTGLVAAAGTAFAEAEGGGAESGSFTSKNGTKTSYSKKSDKAATAFSLEPFKQYIPWVLGLLALVFVLPMLKKSK